MPVADFPRAVCAHVENLGWQTSITAVDDGVHAIAGVKQTPDNRRTLLALVVTDPADSVTTNHVEFLQTKATERDVDTAAIATDLPAPADVRDGITELGISLIDEAAISERRSAANPLAEADSSESATANDNDHPPVDKEEESATEPELRDDETSKSVDDDEEASEDGSTFVRRAVLFGIATLGVSYLLGNSGGSDESASENASGTVDRNIRAEPSALLLRVDQLGDEWELNDESNNGREFVDQSGAILNGIVAKAYVFERAADAQALLAAVRSNKTEDDGAETSDINIGDGGFVSDEDAGAFAAFTSQNAYLQVATTAGFGDKQMVKARANQMYTNVQDLQSSKFGSKPAIQPTVRYSRDSAYLASLGPLLYLHSGVNRSVSTHAVDPVTGEEQWTVDDALFVPREYSAADPPVLFRAEKGALSAYDPASGDRLWRADYLPDTEYDAAPHLAHQNVYVWWDTRMYVIDVASGELVVEGEDTHYNKHEFVAPVTEGVGYAAGVGNDLQVLDLTTGSATERFELGQYQVVDDLLYLTTNDELRALQFPNMTEIWTAPDPSVRWVGATDAMLIGENEENLVGIDRADGSVSWRQPRPDPEVVVAENSVVTPTTAYDATTGERRWQHDYEYWRGFAARPERTDHDKLPLTVLEGTVFVGGRRLHALDLQSGSRKWSFRTGYPAIRDGHALTVLKTNNEGDVAVRTVGNTVFVLDPSTAND